jgi:hypothetical protein
MRCRENVTIKNVKYEEFCVLLSIFFTLGPFFLPEDGGDMFLRNVGWLSVGYMAIYLIKQTPYIHCYENIKSYSYKYIHSIATT